MSHNLTPNMGCWMFISTLLHGLAVHESRPNISCMLTQSKFSNQPSFFWFLPEQVSDCTSEKNGEKPLIKEVKARLANTNFSDLETI